MKKRITSTPRHGVRFRGPCQKCGEPFDGPITHDLCAKCLIEARENIDVQQKMLEDIALIVQRYDYPPQKHDSERYTHHRAMQRYHTDERFQKVVRQLASLITITAGEK